jgi:hypothetical protein
MMAIAMTLLEEGNAGRRLFLFDTFEGMTEPTVDDRDANGTPAATELAAARKGGVNWCCAPLEEVRSNMAKTGYPIERVHYVKGRVEETIPALAPQAVALLRLDTDWYESTVHELLHMYPRLSRNGVLIIDDYGHWFGARKAVEEHFARVDHPVLLQRIDSTGRLVLKTEFRD